MPYADAITTAADHPPSAHRPAVHDAPQAEARVSPPSIPASCTPNAHRTTPPDDASSDPPMVSTVPPSSGPDHGATDRITSEISSYCTPSEVYSSRPLVLTSTDARPDAAATRADSHTSADSLTYVARVTDSAPSHPHTSSAASAADDEKPLPSTVTGVPPSDAPRDGHADDTAAAGRYVKRTPPLADEENCSPFIDTSTTRAPAPLDGGDAHSIWPSPMRRAAAVAPLASKRQRSVGASPNDTPISATRVPPATGPAAGTTALTYSRPCT